MIDSLEGRLQAALQREELRNEELSARAPLADSVPVIPASGPVATFTPRAVPATESLPPDEGRLPPSESVNAWPDEAAEAAFLGEPRAGKEVSLPAPAPLARVEDSPGKRLPKLDDLVQRIPEEAREILEELFRAKFVAVRRVPEKAFKATL